jgi:hypothetical protein
MRGTLLVLALAGCGQPPVRSARPGSLETDAPGGHDSGEGRDSGGSDSGPLDSGPLDSGPFDSGLADTAIVDTAAEEPPPAPVHVAVISDLNGSYGSTSYSSDVDAAIGAIVDDPPDVVLVTGDMVAGQQRGLDYPAMWNGFHASVTTPLTRAGIPLAVTPGNHDASAYGGFEAERAEFARQWDARVPAVTMVDATDYPFRYAFTVRDVLFVSLDATTVGSLSSGQRAWVDAVLATPAAARVVYAHVPIHPFAIGRESEVLGDDALEDILIAHGVDLFVSGHHHAYYPGRHGALRVVSMACLGSGARALIGTTGTSPKGLLRFTVGVDGITGLDAFGGSRFDAPVPRSSLPESVGSGAERVVRDDR